MDDKKARRICSEHLPWIVALIGQAKASTRVSSPEKIMRVGSNCFPVFSLVAIQPLRIFLGDCFGMPAGFTRFRSSWVMLREARGWTAPLYPQEDKYGRWKSVRLPIQVWQ